MRGIRQEELTASLEVSRQTIGSLENGRYNPSILLPRLYPDRSLFFGQAAFIFTLVKLERTM